MTVSFDPYDDDYCSNTDAIELDALSGTNSGYSWTIGSLGILQLQSRPEPLPKCLLILLEPYL